MNDLKKEGITGNVKMVQIKEYSIKTITGNEEKEFLSETKLGYNEKGYKTSQENYVYNSLAWREEIDYDIIGRKVEEAYFDMNGITARRIEYVYNEIGKLSLLNQYDGLSMFPNVSQKFVYNKNGKLLTTSYIDNNDLLTYTRKFNNKGIMVESIGSDYNGVIQKKTAFKYDFWGNLIGEYTYNNNGELSYQVLSKYDKKGKIKEYYSDQNKNDPAHRLYSYTYYKNGNQKECIERIIDKNTGKVMDFFYFFTTYDYEYY
jgi:hypothetical protein